MNRSRLGLIGLCSAVVASALGIGAAGTTTVPGCATSSAVGEWPSYSGRLPEPGAPGGNRIQPSEQAISPANVSKLGVAWKLDMPDGGLIHSTPSVADGCVFVGTDLGTVYAINADTGSVVWKNKLADDGGSSPFVGAGIVGSPAIVNGRVFVGVTAPNESIEVALDEITGQTLWSTRVDADSGGGVDSSPVPFDTGGGLLLFQAYQGDESSPHSNPGWAILDAGTGAIVTAGKTIPAAAYAGGDRGGSIVDTPAIDVDAKVAYAGTGNPASVHQNPVTDALVKIDLNPSNATFGQIIGSARGTSDSYPSPKDINLPTCPRTRNLQWPVGPFGCGSLDFDFFSTGDLYTASNGRQMFAEIQKSGVMQAVNTSDMSVAWKTTLNVGCFFCNGGSTAADANGIYVATTGGNLFALNKETGAIKWAIVGTGSYHYNGVTVANGVVYDINDLGFLEAIDASNGRPLLAHPLLTETGGPYQDGENSSGVSVARDTVFAASTNAAGGGSALFAFKLGAGSGGLPLPNLPPLPTVPAPALAIVSLPGATTAGYATQILVIRKGSKLNYANLDNVSHDVVSVAKAPNGSPLFSSAIIGLAKVVPVNGFENVGSGTYAFYCSIHPWMTGKILVR